MKNNKKKILAIVLVVVVLLLGAASIYVATQLSTRQAVAPTAPESKPAAFEPCGERLVCSTTQISGASQCTDSLHLNGWWCCPSGKTNKNGACVDFVWTGTTATCTAIGSAAAAACIPSSEGIITCNPDCPTSCGLAASTISTCTDSCGNAKTKSCPATEACAPEDAVLEGNKKAYKNVTANVPGKYTLSTEISSISKSQIYVYAISITNTSEATATGVTIKDSLKELTELTFMDTVSGCSWSAANVELTCSTTLKPDESKTFSFRVKASDALINGNVITNTANVTAENANSLTLTNDLTVSTVVGCNHTCTTDEECSNGLKCDATTGKCRNDACVAEDDCTCAVVAQITAAPKTPTATKAVTPTKVATAAATPTVLPETGILDLPGVAAFGGGLFLAIVGILLAL